MNLADNIESPAWVECINALRQIWTDSSTFSDPQPNRMAIEAAIAWVAYLRKRFPGDPPTCLATMSHDAEKRAEEMLNKLRKLKGLCPMTPEEADAAYDAAPEVPLSQDKIRSIVDSVTSMGRY
jgi:hypothetical protein